MRECFQKLLKLWHKYKILFIFPKNVISSYVLPLKITCLTKGEYFFHDWKTNQMSMKIYVLHVCMHVFGPLCFDSAVRYRWKCYKVWLFPCCRGNSLCLNVSVFVFDLSSQSFFSFEIFILFAHPHKPLNSVYFHLLTIGTCMLLDWE